MHIEEQIFLFQVRVLKVKFTVTTNSGRLVNPYANLVIQPMLVDCQCLQITLIMDMDFSVNTTTLLLMNKYRNDFGYE